MIEDPKSKADASAKEVLKKGSPLAYIIWEREKLKKLENNSTPQEWLSSLTKQLGKIAQQIEQQPDKIEEEIVKTAAVCLMWIEKLREKIN